MQYTTLGRTRLEGQRRRAWLRRVSAGWVLGAGGDEVGDDRHRPSARSISASIFSTPRCRLRHRGRARQGDQIGRAQQGGNLHQGAIFLVERPGGSGGDRRRARQFAAPTRHRLYRRLPAARRSAGALRDMRSTNWPLQLRERDSRANSAFWALPRPRRTICRTKPLQPRGVRRGVGCRHGRLFDDAPECPRPGLSVDPREQYRHAADVRGAQHLFAARPAPGDPARACRRGPSRRGARRERQSAGFSRSRRRREQRGRCLLSAMCGTRFGVDVVLFGTGSQAHLKTNIDSLLKPSLPQARPREDSGNCSAIWSEPPARRAAFVEPAAEAVTSASPEEQIAMASRINRAIELWRRTRRSTMSAPIPAMY